MLLKLLHSEDARGPFFLGGGVEANIETILSY